MKDGADPDGVHNQMVDRFSQAEIELIDDKTTKEGCHQTPRAILIVMCVMASGTDLVPRRKFVSAICIRVLECHEAKMR